MDKYAVDLDQLLNDFEYSELTDGSRNAEPQLNNHVVKHSINNVFHSLNEYLNTDIAPKTAQNDESVGGIRGQVNGVEKTEEIVVEDVKTEEETVKEVVLQEEEVVKNGEEVLETEEVVEVQENNVNNEEVVADVEEKVEELIPINDLQVECTSQKEDLECFNDESKTETVGKNEELQQEQLEEVTTEQNTPEPCDNSSKDQEKVEELKIELDQTCDTTETFEDNEISDCDKNNTATTVETEEKIVGFGEHLDLNDTELNELLDKLEDEFKLEDEQESYQINADEIEETVTKDEENTETIEETIVENKEESQQPEKEAETKTETVTVVEEKPTQEQETVSRPDNLPLTDQSKKIDLIGDPGSTPYNNVYNLPKEKPKVQESDSEYSSSPTFSDASTTDTASTCSADNVPPIEQKQYKKDPRHKTNMRNLNAQKQQAKSEESAEVGGAKDNMEGGDVSTEASSSNVVDDRQHEPAAESTLGKKAPYWMPDHEADKCLHCDAKFTVIKRRHHCRACGKVLCSKCCNLRYRLEYLDGEARVCHRCHESLENSGQNNDPTPHRPNPNNPAEYCSTVSPLEQAGAVVPPPSVMVPVGVLKRQGSNKARHNKTVMFCDGIRPGSDLTNLDNDFNYNNTKTSSRKVEKQSFKPRQGMKIDPQTMCFMSSDPNSLPPTVIVNKSGVTYSECQNSDTLVQQLKNDQLTFALDLNLYVHVKIINMECCINKTVWCFSTEGLINVGQDEVVILLELIEGENVPKDIFYHINSIYLEAVRGSSVKELGLSLHSTSNFLDSKNHAGFVFIKPTFQCLQQVIIPKEPYLIGILIHRWETPWAKLFPLRLVLRLGALYRYYPSPIISTRHRDSVFVEIGHTIINILADFRNYSYTLPPIRGLTIHMEDKNTTMTIPSNRYDQVMKCVNNSTDHILGFAGNFSPTADSHLVCIQDTQNNENCYSTHAINIHNKPRKITGASFIVFNGALKSSSGLTAKSTIVEDGLMIQVLPEHMTELRESLRAMKNYTVKCGCINAATDENVHIVWGENDVSFNEGVFSPVDNTPMTGVPSIRVHNGKDYVCNNGSRLIRWTEVFIIQNNDDSPKNHDPVDISKISESIAKATCSALVKYLDLLVTNSFFKIGIRTNLHSENVSYSAGGNNTKLPPIYMKSLDNELVPVLHRITSNNFVGNTVVLELVFRILNT